MIREEDLHQARTTGVEMNHVWVGPKARVRVRMNRDLERVLAPALRVLVGRLTLLNHNDRSLY